MSTKFSIRPAPRKRPWICKRSPPCLIPPHYPLSLLASFQIQRREPPPPQPLFTGSLILYFNPPGRRYYGTWAAGWDYFNCWFHYDQPTATGWSEAYWAMGPTSDHGNYHKETITLPPILSYDCNRVQADNWDWWTRLKITS